MKNQFLLLLISAAVFTFSCQSGKKGDGSEKAVEVDSASLSASPVSLEKKWESDTLLTTVESVIYNAEKNVIYAACMSGEADVKDGVGFIAQLDKEGNILSTDWVTGLNAPKGMAIHDGKLFVTDIDVIVEIDIEQGKVVKTYAVEGAEFLNDADVDAAGNVYVSAMRTSRLIKLSNGEVSVFLDSVAIPNGVFVEGGDLLTAYWDEQKIKRINISTKEVTEIAGGIENPDGIKAVGDGGYLVSSWNGKVTYVSKDGETFLIMDTTEEGVSAADIEYIPELKLLLVPTFYGNNVVAYELKN